jgi:protein TonB
MSEPVSCGNFEGLAVLYALGELEEPARAAVEQHAQVCAHCADVLRRETTLATILAPGDRPAAEQEPSDLLLARCRSQLSKALDEAAAKRSADWRQWLRPRNWAEIFRVSARFHPAWSIAALLLVAAVSGLAGWQGLGRIPLDGFGPAVITVSAAPPPPVAPAVPKAEPQTPAPSQSAADTGPSAGQNRIYTATDAGMSDAPAQSLNLWRNEPPPRIPAGLRSMPPAAPGDAASNGGLADLSRRMERFWWGGVRVDPSEQQKRLVKGSLPEYPEVARRAGIEGQVTLLLHIGRDGSVEDTKLLSGEPILGRAASEAVEQWRYRPVRIDGQPVNVLTSVTLAFRLPKEFPHAR